MSLVENAALLAGKREQLTHDLARLDQIPDALSLQTQHLEQAKEGLDTANIALKTLEKTVKATRQAFLDRKGTGLRGLGNKLFGKKSARADEEIRILQGKYQDAVVQEQQARQVRDEAAGRFSDEERTHQELLEVSKRRDGLQDELESLLGEVFDGFTPEFPDEDRLERRWKHVTAEHHALEAQLNKYREASDLLKNIQTRMRICQSQLARSNGSFAMHGDGQGGPVNSMGNFDEGQVESAQSDMLACRELATQLYRLLEKSQRQRAWTKMSNNDPIHISKIAMTDDQYYKLGSKKDFREAVLTSLNQVRRMIPEIQAEIEDLELTQSQRQEDGQKKHAELLTVRHELIELRQNLFDRILKGDIPSMTRVQRGTAHDAGTSELPSYMPAEDAALEDPSPLYAPKT